MSLTPLTCQFLTGLKVPTSLEQWNSSSGVFRASINSFGYGGTNAHIIIEDLGTYLATHSSFTDGASITKDGRDELNGKSKARTELALLSVLPLQSPTTETLEIVNPRMFTLSSFNKATTQAQARDLLTYLREKDLSERQTEEFLDDLAFTLNERRSRFSWRIALLVRSIEDLKKVLESGTLEISQASSAIPRLGFVFTGQGAQWHAMGRELFDRYSVYRGAIIQANEVLRNLGAKWSLIGMCLPIDWIFRS